MPEIENVVPCNRGYHLCRAENLIEWLKYGTQIWEAKGRGEMIEEDDKVVFSQARLVRRLNWNDSLQIHFSCDCAERVLHLAKDKRCNEVLRVARLYADGKATQAELLSADSADRAARAAWADRADRAASAAWAASADRADRAASAAWAASADRADRAAWADRADSAARDASGASAAEKKWQTEHLVEILWKKQ